MVIFACLYEDDLVTYIWYCLCLTDNQSSINVLYTWGLVHKAISNLLEAANHFLQEFGVHETFFAIYLANITVCWGHIFKEVLVSG